MANQNQNQLMKTQSFSKNKQYSYSTSNQTNRITMSLSKSQEAKESWNDVAGTLGICVIPIVDVRTWFCVMGMKEILSEHATFLGTGLGLLLIVASPGSLIARVIICSTAFVALPIVTSKALYKSIVAAFSKKQPLTSSTPSTPSTSHTLPSNITEQQKIQAAKDFVQKIRKFAQNLKSSVQNSNGIAETQLNQCAISLSAFAVALYSIEHGANSDEIVTKSGLTFSFEKIRQFDETGEFCQLFAIVLNIQSIISKLGPNSRQILEQALTELQSGGASIFDKYPWMSLLIQSGFQFADKAMTNKYLLDALSSTQ